MVAIPALIRLEQTRWASCQISPGKQVLFDQVAKRLCATRAKEIYLAIQARTSVPWFVIAVIHERESTQNFARSLAQGDPWNAVSVHVPKGRGPFKSFEDAAYDALVNCAPFAAKWADWSAGGTLTLLEMYNGLGYANKGVPSPYVWAGTNQYAKGKYVADGKYDPDKVDTQLGVAGLLMAMVKLDASVRFVGGDSTAPSVPTVRVSPSKPAVPVVASPSIVPSSGPSISNPSPGSIGDAVAKLFHALFSHV